MFAKRGRWLLFSFVVLVGRDNKIVTIFPAFPEARTRQRSPACSNVLVLVDNVAQIKLSRERTGIDTTQLTELRLK